MAEKGIPVAEAIAILKYFGACSGAYKVASRIADALS
jgi:hypothetical protein